MMVMCVSWLCLVPVSSRTNDSSLLLDRFWTFVNHAISLPLSSSASSSSSSSSSSRSNTDSRDEGVHGKTSNPV